MRALAHVEKISALDPIEGADRIERATVLGWHLVVKKGEFKVGEFCVYVEVDSILPEKPEFEFLRERKFRVKTIKLKGQVSQGICFPLSIIPHGVLVHSGKLEGADVTELLGIRKYDPEGDAERAKEEAVKQTKLGRVDKYLRRNAWYRLLFPKRRKTGGNPKLPEFIKKTDEERVQNLTSHWEEWKKLPFVVTEKIDGQSGTYFLVNKRRLFGDTFKFGICSRNFELPTRQGSYWQHAEAVDMKTKMKKLAESVRPKHTLVLQGELAGPGIQGNKYGFKELHFFAFNLIIDGIRMSQLQLRDTIEWRGIQCVPLLEISYRLPDTIDELLKGADGESEVGDTIREGVVLRSGDISFKAISNEFLLKYGG
jgi:hypothetical protein